MRQRGSIASTTLKMQRTRTESSVNRLRSNSNLTSASLVDDTTDDDVVHAVEPRARTAMLPPVLVSFQLSHYATPQNRTGQNRKLISHQAKSIDEHPLCWLGFEEDCILTSCKNGTYSLVPFFFVFVFYPPIPTKV